MFFSNENGLKNFCATPGVKISKGRSICHQLPPASGGAALRPFCGDFPPVCCSKSGALMAMDVRIWSTIILMSGAAAPVVTHPSRLPTKTVGVGCWGQFAAHLPLLNSVLPAHPDASTATQN